MKNRRQLHSIILIFCLVFLSSTVLVGESNELYCIGSHVQKETINSNITAFIGTSMSSPKKIRKYFTLKLFQRNQL